MSSTSADVLVVGAGPTGLALAVALAARGRAALVVDRQAAGANTSRAAVVHARTLEALEGVGVAPRLVALGLRCATFTVRDRDRELARFDFAQLPTRYPYALMLSQAATESVLLARLGELGGAVLRPRTLVALAQDDAGVEAELDDGTRLRARYLVGADGMHSTVRERAGIAFAGGSYAESFVLADVRLTGGVAHDEVTLYFSPAGLVVVAPLPGGAHRVVATVDAAPEHPALADIQALLDARGPERERARVRELIWGSRFHVHHSVAERYRERRVLLAGDAAHVHSPAGGQGMNTGVQDAVALADALAAALAGAGEAPLDAWAAARRPVALEVVALADRLTRLATLSHWLRPLRNALLWSVARSPAFRRRLTWQLSGLAWRPSHA